jgi:hypothetical protein
MDNMLEKIYQYVYVGSYAFVGGTMILYLINPHVVTIKGTYIVFGIITFILFLMGRLIQERFDNTLQMYLIIVSIFYLVSAFIPYDGYGWITVFEALSAIVIFGAAFLLDGIFSSE